jgi:hypothetical protein
VNAAAGAGFARMLTSRDGRALHDVICATDVIDAGDHRPR